MKAAIALILLLTIPAAIYCQKDNFVVHYDFKEKADPPMKPFYLRVFVDNVLTDSTKPHKPSHNLANSVRMTVTDGCHQLRVEGIVVDEMADVVVLNKVMEWK